MPIKNRIYIFLAIIAGLPLAAAAQGEPYAVISVAGTKIPGIFDDEIPGPYNTVFADLDRSTGNRLRLKYLPLRRAQRILFSGKTDCFFVGTNQPDFYIARGIPEHRLLISDSINRVSVKAFTRPGEPLISTSHDLEHKVVALDIATGSTAAFKKSYLPAKTDVISTNSVAQALAILDQGRVHAAICFDFDMIQYIRRRPEASKYMHDPDFSVLVNDSVICWRSKKTEALLTEINRRLAQLRASGQLGEMLAAIPGGRH